MSMTTPKIEERKEQPYMGIRVKTTMQDLGTVIPQLLTELFDWSGTQEMTQVGVPFIRYHVIDMERLLDVEVGVPVADPLAGNARIRPGVLPAGRYASLVYTGVANAIPANGALLDWGTQQGLVWDRRDTPEGDAFRSRLESFLTGPAEDPDPAHWQTEVAIQLADVQDTFQ